MFSSDFLVLSDLMSFGFVKKILGISGKKSVRIFKKYEKVRMHHSFN
jgi:hypothetical protein